MGSAIRTRPGTLDASILDCLGADNEYRLPDAFEPDDVVLDIGMHIGGFGVEALRRGAGRVYGFEAERSNFEIARENLASFGPRAVASHQAIWRSDRPATTLTFYPSRDPANTGGGGMIFWRDEPRRAAEAIEAVPLDDVLGRLSDDGRRRVRLLKIDCEGSEFPILLTSRRLDCIDEIVGEFHEVGGDFDGHAIPEDARVSGFDRFTIEGLAGMLERSGFRVEAHRHGRSHMGLFFARREDAPRRRGSFASRLGKLWRSHEGG